MINAFYDTRMRMYFFIEIRFLVLNINDEV